MEMEKEKIHLILSTERRLHRLCGCCRRDQDDKSVIVSLSGVCMYLKVDKYTGKIAEIVSKIQDLSGSLESLRHK